MSNFANPAPLGLLAFGLTTLLLNVHNAGFYKFTAVNYAMGLAYGGFAQVRWFFLIYFNLRSSINFNPVRQCTIQVVVGIMEFVKGNNFGTVVFSSYGFFWWSLILNNLLPIMYPSLPATPPGFMSWYLTLWGILTLFFWIGTFNKNRVLQLLFITLVVLFFLLAIAFYIKGESGDETLLKIAGFVDDFSH
jgi:hypothetical protein